MNLIRYFVRHTLKIVIIDDLFPHPACLDSWRGSEFNAYLKHFPQLCIYTTLLSRRLVDSTSIESIMEQYAASAPPKWNRRVRHINSNSFDDFMDLVDFEDKLIHSPDFFYFLFLNNVYSSLGLIDRYRKPFLFTLYPGGGFGLENEESDKKLQAVVTNTNFRGVLVTSNVTYRYLIDNGFCKESQVFALWGGIISDEFLKTEQYYKNRYGFGKETFDICFVANRYSKIGQDKGYDVFIKVAKLLFQKSSLFKFHVAGSFDTSVLDVSDLGDNITFYGIQDALFFDSFYHDKDLFISPNQPNILGKGSFDGFPTGCAVDALVHKTAVFCTDLTKPPQNMGQYIPGKEIEIISIDCSEILNKVMYYFERPLDLAELGDNGAKKARELYNAEKQILPRIQWLENNGISL